MINWIISVVNVCVDYHRHRHRHQRRASALNIGRNEIAAQLAARQYQTIGWRVRLVRPFYDAPIVTLYYG